MHKVNLTEGSIDGEADDVELEEVEVLLEDIEVLLEEIEILLEEIEVLLEEIEVLLKELEVLLKELEVLLREIEVLLEETEVVAEEVLCGETEIAAEEAVPDKTETIPEEVVLMTEIAAEELDDTPEDTDEVPEDSIAEPGDAGIVSLEGEKVPEVLDEIVDDGTSIGESGSVVETVDSRLTGSGRSRTLWQLAGRTPSKYICKIPSRIQNCATVDGKAGSDQIKKPSTKAKVVDIERMNAVQAKTIEPVTASVERKPPLHVSWLSMMENVAALLMLEFDNPPLPTYSS